MIERIRLIIAEKMGVPLQMITADLSLTKTALDSLEFVELLQSVESEFWRIPDERWTMIDSANDIVRELEACKA